MKKYHLAIVMLLSFITTAVSADGFVPVVSETGQISSLSARTSGYNHISFTGSVPDQGCTSANVARGIIVGTGNGGQLMDIALSALDSGNQVKIKVDGCSLVDEGSTSTAPRIIKIEIFGNID